MFLSNHVDTVAKESEQFVRQSCEILYQFLKSKFCKMNASLKIKCYIFVFIILNTYLLCYKYDNGVNLYNI